MSRADFYQTKKINENNTAEYYMYFYSAYKGVLLVTCDIIRKNQAIVEKICHEIEGFYP